MEDCKLCVHKPVCDLWRSNECQAASSFSSTEDGCDFFLEERRWIPVTERLPDRNGEYICRHGYNGNTDIKFTGVLEYYATDEKPHWQHDSIGLTVTHWMPLPEPPKEDA